MPRRELLHSPLYDPAKWRESLIYIEQGTAFSSRPQLVIGQIRESGLQAVFKTNEMLTFFAGIGHLCLSICFFSNM